LTTTRRKKIPIPEEIPEESLEERQLKLERALREIQKGPQDDGVPDPRCYTPDRHVPQLTESELKQISRHLTEDFDRMNNMPQWALLWQSRPSEAQFGQIADLPEAQLLHWMDLTEEIWSDRENVVPMNFQTRVFEWIADKVVGEDALFFKRLAYLLEAKKNQTPLREIQPIELGIKQNPGRKVQPYNLGTVFPKAVEQLFCYRTCETPPDSLKKRTHRITREELKKEILRLQVLLGDPAAVEISDNELSRHIAKSPVRDFME